MKQNIKVYTSMLCPVCQMVKDFLVHLDVPFKEDIVDIRPMTRMKLIVNTKKFTLPKTNINGEWVSGFDPVRMLRVINGENEE